MNQNTYVWCYGFGGCKYANTNTHTWYVSVGKMRAQNKVDHEWSPLFCAHTHSTNIKLPTLLNPVHDIYIYMHLLIYMYTYTYTYACLPFACMHVYNYGYAFFVHQYNRSAFFCRPVILTHMRFCTCVPHAQEVVTPVKLSGGDGKFAGDTAWPKLSGDNFPVGMRNPQIVIQAITPQMTEQCPPNRSSPNSSSAQMIEPIYGLKRTSH